MNNTISLRKLLLPHDLTFFAGAPQVYHCHHYNLFHDQTVDDILGETIGARTRMRAARSAFHDLLKNLAGSTNLQTPIERLQAAQKLIAAMGHGRVKFDANQNGGSATGQWLHYGHSWNEKYGARIKRHHTADAVVAGFISAAIEVAYNLPKGSIAAEETACIGRREVACSFLIKPTEEIEQSRTVDQNAFSDVLKNYSEPGMHEAEIAEHAKVLQEFMLGVKGDERGLVEAFGVFVTMHLGNYYNETAYEAIRQTEQSHPALLPMAEALFMEAGHVCVFNTFSNILLSPEWESVAGPLASDPLKIITNCLSIARGLGFGRWALQEYIPGKRLVVSSTSNYEAPFWLARYGTSDRGRSYVFQGATLAMMIIATRMKLWERPTLGQETYDQLFNGNGLGFRAELLECQTMGAQRTVAIVEAV